MKLTSLEQRIYSELYDDLQTFRFTRVADPRSGEQMETIVKKIAAIIERERNTDDK